MPRHHLTPAQLRDLAQAALTALSRPKQGTRMRKWVCSGCGQIVRAATDDLRASHHTPEGKLCGRFTKETK